MKELAMALSVGLIAFATAWGVRGCAESLTAEAIEKVKIQVEQEKSKQIQYQWKIDSLKKE
jgi:hypothetical protein